MIHTKIHYRQTAGLFHFVAMCSMTFPTSLFLQKVRPSCGSQITTWLGMAWRLLAMPIATLKRWKLKRLKIRDLTYNVANNIYIYVINCYYIQYICSYLCNYMCIYIYITLIKIWMVFNPPFFNLLTSSLLDLEHLQDNFQHLTSGI